MITYVLIIAACIIVLVLIISGAQGSEQQKKYNSLRKFYGDKPFVLHADNRLDEIRSKAYARGADVSGLGKKKAQQIRGVDMYRCLRCGKVGAPWEWVIDLDETEEYIINDACKCGGTVTLID